MIPIGTEISGRDAGDHQGADDRVRGAAAADHAARVDSVKNSTLRPGMPRLVTS